VPGCFKGNQLRNSLRAAPVNGNNVEDRHPLDLALAGGLQQVQQRVIRFGHRVYRLTFQAP